MISQQSESPYDFGEALRVTRNRIVLIAQNHRFMTEPRNERRHWMLIKALKRGVTVEIVGMQPDAKPSSWAKAKEPADALNVWAYYLNAPAFFQHVEDCWDALQSWKRRAKSAGLTTFRHWNLLYPLTMTAVDPEDAHEFLILSPRPLNESKMSKPQIIIYKRSCPVSFEYYWLAINNSFDHTDWREI